MEKAGGECKLKCIRFFCTIKCWKNFEFLWKKDLTRVKKLKFKESIHKWDDFIASLWLSNYKCIHLWDDSTSAGQNVRSAIINMWYESWWSGHEFMYDKKNTGFGDWSLNVLMKSCVSKIKRDQWHGENWLFHFQKALLEQNASI